LKNITGTVIDDYIRSNLRGFPNGNKSIETFGDVPAVAIFYRFTFGISAGGLGMSSPKSVGVGSEGFASLMCLAT